MRVLDVVPWGNLCEKLQFGKEQPSRPRAHFAQGAPTGKAARRRPMMRLPGPRRREFDHLKEGGTLDCEPGVVDEGAEEPAGARNFVRFCAEFPAELELAASSKARLTVAAIRAAVTALKSFPEASPRSSRAQERVGGGV